MLFFYPIKSIIKIAKRRIVHVIIYKYRRLPKTRLKLKMELIANILQLLVYIEHKWHIYSNCDGIWLIIWAYRKFRPIKYIAESLRSAFQKSLKENVNMSANHIELRNDIQGYENQLYRTTPKYLKSMTSKLHQKEH